MSLWKVARYLRLGFQTSSFLRCLCKFSNGVGAEIPNDADLLESFTSPRGEPIIAGRPFLPGSDGARMPRYLSGPRGDFPWVVDMDQVTSTKTPSKALANATKSILQENLPKYGAVLLRNLPLENASDFATFHNHLGFSTLPYIGGNGVRDGVDGDVMTASREPPCYTIEPHNEMSYSPTYPTHIAFFCEVPPEPGCGGESVFVANRDLQAEIDPEVKEKFKRLGIRYTTFLPSKDDSCYLSWQEVFLTDDRQTAEQIMSDRGYSYRWQSDGSVIYWYHLPATTPHHTTGEEIWFNQAHMNASYYRAHPYWGSLGIPDEKMPFHSYYGDGTDIEPEVTQHIRDVTWKHAIGAQMQKGELMFLDNMLVQHGRLGYVGQRRLLVTLINDMP